MMDESWMTGKTENQRKDTLISCMEQYHEHSLFSGPTPNFDGLPTPVLIAGSFVVDRQGKAMVVHTGQLKRMFSYSNCYQPQMYLSESVDSVMKMAKIMTLLLSAMVVLLVVVYLSYKYASSDHRLNSIFRDILVAFILILA